ncbi:MAG: polysaccharide deacetylase family protein [Alphaproteobacteria bacterium]
MADWHDLERELDAWQGLDRAPTFWWRDDDAVSATSALERLLALARENGAPLALAVIPAAAEQSLVRRLDGARQVAVLQHGYAHLNHAPPERRKCELGPDRPAATVLDELSAGRERLRALFGGRALAVLVPPWNRIDGAVARSLADAGFRGLSALGPRPERWGAPGLRQVDVHVDLVDWRGGRGFVGLSAALDQVLGHLAARRGGRAEGEDEPTGLMTHHLVHDAGCWDFVAELLARTRARPAARWLAAEELFPG